MNLLPLWNDKMCQQSECTIWKPPKGAVTPTLGLNIYASDETWDSFIARGPNIIIKPPVLQTLLSCKMSKRNIFIPKVFPKIGKMQGIVFVRVSECFICTVYDLVDTHGSLAVCCGCEKIFEHKMWLQNYTNLLLLSTYFVYNVRNRRKLCLCNGTPLQHAIPVLETPFLSGLQC